MQYQSGLVEIGEVTAASNKLLFAQFDLADKPSERIRILKEAVSNMKRVEEIMKTRYEEGTFNYTRYLEYQAERLTTEIKLYREIGNE